MTRLKIYQFAYLSLLLFLLLLLSSCRPAETAASQPTAFDYEQAAASQIYRWEAMADFYAAHNLLNEPFDYAQAAENQAYRWQAMADFYASTTN